jgi:uncharacterized membrane protein
MKKTLSITLTTIALTGIALSFQNCADLLSDSSHSASSEQQRANDAAYQAVTAEARAVLQNYCVSCHNPNSGVSTSIPDILNQAFLESQGFIVIGSPQSSSLYLDIIDGIEPRNGQTMSNRDIEVLRDWILGPNLFNDEIGGGIGGGGGTPAIPATFASVNSRIIQPLCVSCHGAGSANGSLVNYNAVRVYVTPNSLAGSELWQQVALNQMPQAAPLNAELKSLLQRWILEGAQNN